MLHYISLEKAFFLNFVFFCSNINHLNDKQWNSVIPQNPPTLSLGMYPILVKCENSAIRGEECIRSPHQLCIHFLALESSALSEISSQSFMYTVNIYVCKSVNTNKNGEIYKSFIAELDAAACCWILKFKQHYCGLEFVRLTCNHRGHVYYVVCLLL